MDGVVQGPPGKRDFLPDDEIGPPLTPLYEPPVDPGLVVDDRITGETHLPERPFEAVREGAAHAAELEPLLQHARIRPPVAVSVQQASQYVFRRRRENITRFNLDSEQVGRPLLRVTIHQIGDHCIRDSGIDSCPQQDDRGEHQLSKPAVDDRLRLLDTERPCSSALVGDRSLIGVDLSQVGNGAVVQVHRGGQRLEGNDACSAVLPVREQAVGRCEDDIFCVGRAVAEIGGIRKHHRSLTPPRPFTRPLLEFRKTGGVLDELTFHQTVWVALLSSGITAVGVFAGLGVGLWQSAETWKRQAQAALDEHARQERAAREERAHQAQVERDRFFRVEKLAVYRRATEAATSMLRSSLLALSPRRAAEVDPDALPVWRGVSLELMLIAEPAVVAAAQAIDKVRGDQWVIEMELATLQPGDERPALMIAPEAATNDELLANFITARRNDVASLPVA